MGFRRISGRLFAVLWLLTLYGALQAQRFSFQRYGESQGLTNLVITDLIQDKQGYIWAATFNGLFRYDGTSFERFGEKEGLATSGSIYLLETPSGDLWAVTNRALYRLEGKHFHKFDMPVHLNVPQAAVWQERSSSFILATDNGLVKVPFRDGRFGNFDFDPSTEKLSVPAVYAAPDGNIWYVIPSGPCRVQAENTICFSVREGVPKDHWTAVRMDRNGDLWIRSEKRLYVLHRGRTHFEDWGSTLPSADGTGVLSLDREGNLFVPTQGGLARRLNGRWKLVTMREGLTSGDTEIALEDREGSLWIGHLGAGLERWRGYDSWEGWTDLEGLENSSILAIKPAGNGDLFLGTDRGLLRFRPGVGTVRTWLEKDGLAGDHVFALLYDRAGNLWTGSAPGGISCLDTHTGRIHRIYPRPGQLDVSISSLAMDADGSIWAGYQRGLVRFRGSLQTGFRPDVPSGTPSAGVSGMLVDHAGRMWAASDGKLYVRVDEKWIALGKSQGLAGQILFITQPPDGSIVVLNTAAQVYRLIDRQGQWSATVLPPLPAPGRVVPYFVGSDSRNGIWVGTDRGAFVLEPGRSGWRWHDEDDGLVWNDTNIGAFQRGAGEDIWIGTSRGLAHYTPPHAGHSNAPLRTLISAVQINGQTPSGQAFGPMGTLTWRYPVTSLQLRVTALTFLNESRTRFLYRRRGIDKTWLMTDSRVIMYSDLKPGTYTFDVLAESTDGVIGSEPASITLIVLPPWYLTRPFLCLSAITVLLLVIVSYRWRMRSFMIRQRELESAVAERTAALEAERTLEHNQHRVLEMITSGSSLAQIFEGIKDLVRSRNNNLECFIHPGMPPIDVSAPGLIRRYIRASSSEPSGWIDFDVTLCNGQEDDPENTMSIALRLASIAIESANAQEKLTHQAYHDSLTGLPNRLQFQWSLDKATAEANTAGEDFALLYIDLDRFKQVNDRCGHRIGDLYLQELSNLFRSCIRKGDLLARLGGDEFAAILPGANGAAAERSVQAIRLALAKPLFIEEFQFHPSASIGFSLCPDNGMDAESLLHAADEAMYDAKVTGMMHSVDCLIESVKT